MIPGNVGSSFFLNELPIAKEYYKEISIIDFANNRIWGKRIEQQYGFRYYNCRIDVFNWKYWKTFCGWLKKKYVREEIKNNITFSVTGLKKLIYILFYGFYAIAGKLIIDKEIQESEGNIDLYAFWLSRPAFLAAQYSLDSNVRRIVSRAHGYDVYVERNATNYLPFRQYIDSNLDTVYFISENGKDYYNQKYASFGVKMEAQQKVSRLGVFESDYKKQYKKKEKIVIASCSSINAVKRLDLIVRVIAGLKECNLQWIHVGDGELKEEILQLCKKELKEDSYKFFGNVENEKIIPLYADLDVDYFINLSDSEGIPVAIMEALAFGIPVIARDVGGIKEIVKSDNGLVLPTIEDIEAVQEQVKKYIDIRYTNIELYQKYSHNARKEWEENFSASKNYKLFYESLLKDER